MRALMILAALIGPRLFAFSADEQTETIAPSLENEPKDGRPSHLEKFFVQVYAINRKRHSEAVKNIRETESYEKRYKMASILLENCHKVVESNREPVEALDFEQGEGEPLKNETLRNALATILENCALLADVVVQLPEISRRIAKRKKSEDETLGWCLRFAAQTSHLVDPSTIGLFHAARQELKLAPPDPTYVNPYASTSERTVERRKEKKRQKAPRMINVEF